MSQFSPLPRFLSIRRIDTFPLKDAAFPTRDPLTRQTKLVKALHRASCTGICRGKERLYILFENEDTGNLYLEELIKDSITETNYFVLVEDVNEWKHILAYISYHLVGANQISDSLKRKLDKKIRNLAGISQEYLENLVISNPDFQIINTVQQEPTAEDEEQREELKKRD